MNNSLNPLPEEIFDWLSTWDIMSRRTFLFAATTAAVVSSTIWWAAEAANSMNLEQERYTRSLNAIWYDEMNFFRNFFNIHDFSDFSDNWRVIQLQHLLQITWDGVIWPMTLEQIYRNYYMRNRDQLPFLQRIRLSAMLEIIPYPSLHRWVWNGINNMVDLYPSSQPQVFQRGYYFWNTVGEPVHGGYINSELVSAFEWEWYITPWYTTIIKRFGWKFILWLFVNWQLILASYSSPWNPNVPGGSLSPTWFFPASRTEQHPLQNRSHPTWITWSRQTLRREWTRLTSAPMPYVCWLNRHGIWVHAWNTTWDRESLWCYRLPLHYAKWFYDYFEESGRNMNWDIRET